jgi:hypothetical protein
MAPVALNELNKTHPYDFRTAIYTQWAMIGICIVIYVIIPESPCGYTEVVLGHHIPDRHP